MPDSESEGTNSSISSSVAAGENQIRDPMFYLRLLGRRRWLILSIFALVVSSVAFYTLREPKIYQARTTVIIDATAPRFLDNSQVQEVVDSGAGNYWFNKEYYETQYKVVESRAVSSRVVEKLGLNSDLAFLGLSKVPESQRQAMMRKLDATALLQSRIKVHPVKDSRLLYIVVEDTDPERSALLANEVADAYIAENLALKLKTTETAERWLEERRRSLESLVHESELVVYKFKKDADMLTTSLEDRQSMVSQRLNSLNLALTEVRTRIAGLKAKVEAIRSAKQPALEGEEYWASGLPGALDNLLIQQLKARTATQAEECVELKERYLADHPKLQSCQEKLRSTQSALLAELNNLIRAAETDLVEASAKEKNLDTLLAAAKAEAFEVNKKQIEFDRLKREADNNQRLYDLVLKRLKEIELSGLLRTSNVRVLDFARPDPRPVRPDVKLRLVVAVLFGLLLGISTAFGVEYLDTTINDQLQLEQWLQVPVLGIIPKFEKEAVGGSLDFASYRQPRSQLAECCRSVRTNLLFMSPEKPLRTILITSSGPQEGKTTAAINLATAMAESGSRVLLVDADMRRPRLHRAFNVANGSGLSSLIVGEGPWEEALKETEISRLLVLTCGPIPPNPAELLHTVAFSQLLSAMASKFDRIIIDSPPIRAVSDAVVLSALVDGTVLVVKAATTSRDMARLTLRSLRDVNARILGAVLSHFDMENRRYGYSTYVYYRYGYPAELEDKQVPS